MFRFLKRHNRNKGGKAQKHKRAKLNKKKMKKKSPTLTDMSPRARAARASNNPDHELESPDIRAGYIGTPDNAPTVTPRLFASMASSVDSLSTIDKENRGTLWSPSQINTRFVNDTSTSREPSNLSRTGTGYEDDDEDLYVDFGFSNTGNSSIKVPPLFNRSAEDILQEFAEINSARCSVAFTRPPPLTLRRSSGLIRAPCVPERPSRHGQPGFAGKKPVTTRRRSSAFLAAPPTPARTCRRSSFAQSPYPSQSPYDLATPSKITSSIPMLGSDRRQSSFVEIETLDCAGTKRCARLQEVDVPKQSRNEAEQLLSGKPGGSFVFRDSKGVVILSINDPNGSDVHHIQVQSDNAPVTPEKFAGSKFRALIRKSTVVSTNGKPLTLNTLIMV